MDDDDDYARGALIGMLIRRWGMAALRANARLLLDRLAHVGRGAAAANDRRASAFARAGLHSSRQQSGPRLWRLRRAMW